MSIISEGRKKAVASIAAFVSFLPRGISYATTMGRRLKSTITDASPIMQAAISPITCPAFSPRPEAFDKQDYEV